MNVYNLYQRDSHGDKIQKTAIARSLSEIPDSHLYSVTTITKFPDGEESIRFIPAAIAQTIICQAMRAMEKGVSTLNYNL